MSKSKESDSEYNLRSKGKDSLKQSKDDDDFPEELEKLSPEEYKKLLAKLFPSKYIQKQVDEIQEDNDDDDDDEDSDEEEDEEEEDEEEEDEDEEEEDEDEEEESDEESDDEDTSDEEDIKGGEKINIILTIGDAGNDNDSDSDSDSDYETVSEEEEEEEDIGYEDWSKTELRNEIKARGLKCINMKNKTKMIKTLEEQDDLPYDEWSKEDLKDELRIRGIRFSKNAKEKSLISMLEQNDAETAVDQVNSMFSKKEKSSKKEKPSKEKDAANTLVQMKNGPQEKLSDNHVIRQFKELADKLTSKDHKNKMLGRAKTHIEEMEREVEKNKKKEEKK